MFKGNRVLAIVPARGGSKGLPGKNLRHLAGKPLVAWPIEAALATPCIDAVVVSTEDPKIAHAALVAGAEVPFIRPLALATDEASSAAVLRHALEAMKVVGRTFEYVVMLEPTSPLTEARDVMAALSLLHSARERADSIVGISRVQAAHPEYDVRLGADQRITPYAARDFSGLRRRQEIEELYFLEGTLYISSVEAFLVNDGFYHERTLGFVVPRWKSLEIDELLDFICIEAVMQRRDELSGDSARQYGRDSLPNKEFT